MSWAQGILMAALVVVAITHTISRIGGALATIGWSVAALLFGVWTFQQTGRGLMFAGVETPPWMYVATMLGVAVYNAALVVKALRRRRTGDEKRA
jgi:hypothetical protein